MDILNFPYYKSPLDDGIKNPLPIISIGPAKDVEYYTTKQQQFLNEKIKLYMKMSKNNT